MSRMQGHTNGKIKLLLAAYDGHEEIVKLLLDTAKVDINSRDTDSIPPFLETLRRGHADMVKRLLYSGEVNIHVRIPTASVPLYWLVRQFCKSHFTRHRSYRYRPGSNDLPGRHNGRCGKMLYFLR